MALSYEWKIALRYLKNRGGRFPSLTSWIAILGVALGVMALIVVLAVMNGLELDLKEKILNASAHIVLEPKAKSPLPANPELLKKLDAVPSVAGASPFILLKAMIRLGSYSDGVVLRGVDATRIKDVAALQKQMIEGEVDNLGVQVKSGLLEEPAVHGIILGETLASNLRVFPGERVQLLIPGAISTPMGRKPRVRTFQVLGIFRSGFFEYDATWAYTSLEGAQDLLKLGDEWSGIELRLSDPFLVETASKALEQSIGSNLSIKTWKQIHAAFFSALQLEKLAMFIILSLIITVATFNIVSILLMKVMEKNKDIGILKAIGATESSIRKIFLLEGAMIGIGGTCIGFIFGTVGCFLGETYKLISMPIETYDISHLPFKMQASDITFICAASLLMSLMTTIYPSKKAALLDPVEAMRLE